MELLQYVINDLLPHWDFDEDAPRVESGTGGPPEGPPGDPPGSVGEGSGEQDGTKNDGKNDVKHGGKNMPREPGLYDIIKRKGGKPKQLGRWLNRPLKKAAKWVVAKVYGFKSEHRRIVRERSAHIAISRKKHFDRVGFVGILRKKHFDIKEKSWICRDGFESSLFFWGERV